MRSLAVSAAAVSAAAITALVLFPALSYSGSLTGPASLPPAPGDGDAAGMVYPDMPEGRPPSVAVEGADAAEASQMTRYTERVPGTTVEFELAPIPGGKFLLGSPDDEPDRGDDEGPQIEVEISPFWMGVHEVRWDEYLIFMSKLDVGRRRIDGTEPAAQDAWADAVSRPTPPYRPMDFEMGVTDYPAISMTQFAAKHYTKWLSMKTGRFYRLPTEAEWEYACRAGTTTAYSFGDDVDDLEAHGWYFDNSEDSYRKVGQLPANPWGLMDMHGNVAEWVLDQWVEGGYPFLAGTKDPIAWPTTLYPRVARGGSWDDDPDRLRSASRRRSSEAWKQQDPQLPKSIWYLTDAQFVGFRVVRPLVEPDTAFKQKCWDPDVVEIQEILARQRTGAR